MGTAANREYFAPELTTITRRFMAGEVRVSEHYRARGGGDRIRSTQLPHVIRGVVAENGNDASFGFSTAPCATHAFIAAAAGRRRSGFVIAGISSLLPVNWRFIAMAASSRKELSQCGRRRLCQHFRRDISGVALQGPDKNGQMSLAGRFQSAMLPYRPPLVASQPYAGWLQGAIGLIEQDDIIAGLAARITGEYLAAILSTLRWRDG